MAARINHAAAKASSLHILVASIVRRNPMIERAFSR
jgi:hypothetical protein